MNEENDSAIIEVATIEPTEWGCKISAHDKKVYNVNKYLKGTTTLTVAWKQMANMKIKGANAVTEEPGDVVEVWFSAALNKHGGISRYVRSFKEGGGRPLTVDETTKQESPHLDDSVALQHPYMAQPRDDRSYSIGVRGILQALLSNSNIIDVSTLDRSTDVILKAIQIDAELEKKLSSPKEISSLTQMSYDLERKLTPEELAEDLPF